MNLHFLSYVLAPLAAVCVGYCAIRLWKEFQ